MWPLRQKVMFLGDRESRPLLRQEKPSARVAEVTSHEAPSTRKGGASSVPPTA